MTEELGRDGPRLVGYKIRFQDRTNPDTVVKVMTDGILLAETQGDPDLRQYQVLILDEAHERSLNIDFLLGYLQGLLKNTADVLVYTGHPVTDKNVLVLPRDRSLKAHQYVDPRGELRFYPELRVSAVLAAAVGDPVVDNDDLAMIAQVEPLRRRIDLYRDTPRGGRPQHLLEVDLEGLPPADEPARGTGVEGGASGLLTSPASGTTCAGNAAGATPIVCG